MTTKSKSKKDNKLRTITKQIEMKESDLKRLLMYAAKAKIQEGKSFKRFIGDLVSAKLNKE